MAAADPPTRAQVSVLVCTRNRRDNVISTVRSVQNCGYREFEMFVLDQSDDDVTREAVAPLCAEDRRIRYVRLPSPGKPLALNEGLRQSTGRFVFLTDDDCEVVPGWMDVVVGIFEREDRVGCVFGTVEQGPFDPAKGYIPDCKIPEDATIFGVKSFLTLPHWLSIREAPGWRHAGMGANMALRADVVRALQGWDPCIGPGTKFGSGDDNDVAVRVLRAGYGVHFSTESRVVHFGLREWASTPRDRARIAFGFGAVFAKYLRCGTLFHGGLRAPYLWTLQALTLVLRGERPRGLRFVAGWWRGLRAGLEQPIDRRWAMYVADPAGPAGQHSGAHMATVVLRHAQHPPGEKKSGADGRPD